MIKNSRSTALREMPLDNNIQITCREKTGLREMPLDKNLQKLWLNILLK
jgi:hypothetical protein